VSEWREKWAQFDVKPLSCCGYIGPRDVTTNIVLVASVTGRSRVIRHCGHRGRSLQQAQRRWSRRKEAIQITGGWGDKRRETRCGNCVLQCCEGQQRHAGGPRALPQPKTLNGRVQKCTLPPSVSKASRETHCGQVAPSGNRTHPREDFCEPRLFAMPSLTILKTPYQISRLYTIEKISWLI
jgi:hypothetical protein